MTAKKKMMVKQEMPQEIPGWPGPIKQIGDLFFAEFEVLSRSRKTWFVFRAVGQQKKD